MNRRSFDIDTPLLHSTEVCRARTIDIGWRRRWCFLLAQGVRVDRALDALGHARGCDRLDSCGRVHAPRTHVARSIEFSLMLAVDGGLHRLTLLEADLCDASRPAMSLH